MLIAFAFAGYLLGSIPFGLLLTRAAGLGDIRAIGSGNIGATNVLRTGNKGLAAATLALDLLKGTVAVLLAAGIAAALQPAVIDAPASAEALTMLAQERLQERKLAMVAAGFGAFIGHVYPVWLGFRGGKGVATYIGVLAGLFWPAAVIFCAVWLMTAGASRYSSLSALVASIFAPLATALLGAVDLAIFMAPLTLLLLYKHQANISRLLAGKEPRIGERA